MNEAKGRIVGGSAGYLLLILICSVFVSETLVMLLLTALPPLSKWVEALIDSTLLSIAVFPILYFFVFRPLTIYAEQTLNRTEEKYQSIFENAQEGIYQTTADGKFLTINPAGARMLGYDSPEDMITSVTDIGTDMYAFPGERLAFVERLQKQGFVNGFESQLRSKDSGTIWVSENSRAVRDDRGAVVFYEGTMQDITKSKRAAEELRQSEEQFRLISENVADLITLMDEHGKCLYAGRAYRHLGLNPDEVAGTDFLSYIHPDDRQNVRSEIQQVIEAYKDHSIEFRIRGKDGLWRDVETTFSLLINDAGVRLVAVSRDITERRRHEEERHDLQDQLEERNAELESTLHDMRQMQGTLVQSEKMASIGQLTAGIAHEINNPLAFVSSNLNRFEEYFEDTLALLKEWKTLGDSLWEEERHMKQIQALREKETRADVDFIVQDFQTLMRHTREGAERIKSIVEKLRGFSHLSGTDFVESNINDALDDTLTFVWNELKYKATIKKNYGNVPLVRCTIGEIKQVFVNLLVNAAHAIDETGEIALTTFQDADHVLIKISDTGSGIPQKNLSKIFDPFFTTKEVGKGTGLGLWISATIIHKHKGTITAESVVGKGTTFTITLPIRQDEVQGE